MRNKYVLSALTCLVSILLMYTATRALQKSYSTKVIKAGFVYIGDTSTAYTNNFYRAQKTLELKFPENIQTFAKFNVQEDDSSVNSALESLAEEGCDIIFTTSYGYSKQTKLFAQNHPEIQFCQATGDNANSESVLENYHTFMGTIYEGRYVTGIVAGLKLKELNKNKIGYVAAFPIPEVISGYTAFFLGVRSIVPDAVMSVMYTETWSNQAVEKAVAKKLIAEGCTIIAQHSDTTGPALACEEASIYAGKVVFSVGYNQTMTEVAPTTSLISSRINWSPYVNSACEAVLKEKRIESVVKGNIHGNDVAAGFQQNWVEVIGLNPLVVADGTQEKIDSTIKGLKAGNILVFQGNYLGVNPADEGDTWDLNTPYIENANQSAPTFCYVLEDVIKVGE